MATTERVAGQARNGGAKTGVITAGGATAVLARQDGRRIRRERRALLPFGRRRKSVAARSGPGAPFLRFFRRRAGSSRGVGKDDFDRTRKGSLYARAAVPDYWIVNLVDGVVEVYRDPAPDASAAFGWRYRSVTRLAPPATVAPLAFSGERIAVADLLP